MARQPTQTPLVQVLRQGAQSAASARLYLAQTLSARVAESEFAAAAARRAAAAAQIAATAAQTAAQAASAAAAAAYTQAAAAASAAAAAVTAAGAANDRAAVLELTDLWAPPVPIPTPGPTQVLVPTLSFATVPDCSQDADFGTYPLLITFSTEVRAGTSGDDTGVEISISVDGTELQNARRIASFNENACFDTTIALPAKTGAGRSHVEAVWRTSTGASARCLNGRRQLSIIRLGTP